MRKYRLVAKKGEGTFSEVLKAQNVKDGRYHAIKCMKNRFESIDQVNNLREIQALRRLSPHEHIITLEEVLYDQPTGRLALVFELMDANLYELIRGRRHYLNPQLIKSYVWQLMKSLDHMHKKGIFHRDIKPENILIESSTDIGRGLKLADFGSCRGIYSKQPYTEYISTRWYRAPECLLTDGYYGPEMDLWGAGCVMFEITSLYPLFPGSNEVDQISRIHKVLGTPGQDVLQKFRSKGASHISFDFPAQKGIGIPQLIPHAAADGVDLMVKLLKYDASERITAREAMRHPYFRDIRETEARQAAAGGDAASVAGSVGQKTVASGSQLGATKPPQQQVASGPPKLAQNVQPTTVAKALPSIVGGGPDAQVMVKPQATLQQQQQYQQEYQQQQQMSKPSQQIKVNASGGVSGGVSSSLPPIGAGGHGTQQVKPVGQQQQMMQQQMQQQMMMQQQQQQYMQAQASGRAPMQQQSGGSTTGSGVQPNRRRKKYRMTYGQQPQGGGMQQGQAQQQLGQPQGAPQQGGAVDYRANKRAGHEAVLRAYGVPKGMAGGGPMDGQQAQMQAKMMSGQVQQGAPTGLSSYGGHPNRHYAPAKR